MTFQEFQNWVYKINDIYPSYIRVSTNGLGILQLSICFQKDGRVGHVTRCISPLPGDGGFHPRGAGPSVQTASGEGK